jgi:hypothetical protein
VAGRGADVGGEGREWYRLADMTLYGALGYLALGVGFAAGGMSSERGREGLDVAGWSVAFVVGALVELLGYLNRRAFWVPRAVEIARGRRARWADVEPAVLRSVALRLAVGALAGLVVAPVAVFLGWFCAGMAGGTAAEVGLVRRWERRHGRGLYRTSGQRGLAVGPL